HWVFNLNTFIEYVSQKNFLDNSYTRFRNRIGLTVGGKYLRERGDVALVWPYKDCVLEGGQTKEEEKRKEIFFNEVLAEDEITRLLAPKVLTAFTRYTAKGKKPVGELKRDGDGVIRENLIVKGNNLLALHTLRALFRGQAKLIYIDPPFNTGEDEFRYNDKFNHSAWLTFMFNRLHACKELLRSDGIICVNIGNQEVSYLQVLMDDVFGPANYLNHITMTTNDPSGFKATSSKIFSTANHLLIYGATCNGEKLNKLYVRKSYDPAYRFVVLNPKENYKAWRFGTILECLAKQEKMDSVETLRKKHSSQSLREMVESFADSNRAVVFRTAAIGGGALAKRKETIEKSKLHKGKVYQHPGEDVEGFYILNGEQIVFWENVYREIDGEVVPTEALTDVWTDISWTGIAGEGGVTLKSGKKPELLLKRIIELCTKKDDLILDYFVGSGTTCAVAQKMGRRYIGIEQLEYGANDSVVRLQNVIKGDSTGVSKTVGWKGGGEFVYCELMKYNEAFMERIEAAKTSKELVKIWKEMAEGSFLNWYVNPQVPEDAIKDFEAIGREEDGLKKQKRLLAELLDKNQLYVNLSEIDDPRFKVSAEDKALNKAFYGEAYNA
ncbi:MAG: site-specific DNA-methyltransferase, partial [Dechloromonas sp.]